MYALSLHCSLAETFFFNVHMFHLWMNVFRFVILIVIVIVIVMIIILLLLLNTNKTINMTAKKMEWSERFFADSISTVHACTFTLFPRCIMFIHTYWYMEKGEQMRRNFPMVNLSQRLQFAIADRKQYNLFKLQTLKLYAAIMSTLNCVVYIFKIWIESYNNQSRYKQCVQHWRLCAFTLNFVSKRF